MRIATLAIACRRAAIAYQLCDGTFHVAGVELRGIHLVCSGIFKVAAHTGTAMYSYSCVRVRVGCGFVPAHTWCVKVKNYVRRKY